MRYLFLLLFSLSLHSLSAQNSLLDNLKIKAATGTRADSVLYLTEYAYHTASSSLDTALFLLEQAEKLASPLQNDSSLASVWATKQLIHSYRGEYEECIRLNKQLIALYQKTNYLEGLAKAYNGLGIAYYELDNFEQSLSSYLKAKQYFQSIGNEMYQAVVSNNISNCYEALGETKPALIFLEQSFRYFLEEKDSFRLVITGVNLADLNLANQSPEFTDSLFSFLQPFLNEKQYLAAACHFNERYGVFQLKQNQPKAAIPPLRKGYSLYREIGSPRGQAVAAVKLAEAHLALSETAMAQSWLDSIKAYMQTKPGLSLMADFLEVKMSLFMKLGMMDSTEIIYNKLQQVNQELIASKSSESTNKWKVKLEIAEIENKLSERGKELALAKAEVNAKRNLAISIGLIAILSIVSLLLLLKQLTQKQQRLKAKAELSAAQERLRISKDLHDHMGAELTLLSSKLAILVERDNPKPNELQALRKQAKDSMQTLRDTIWSINDESIPLDELVNRLQQQAKRFDLEYTATIPQGINYNLSPKKALNLYRIGQEFIQNTAKYATSKKLEIQIERGKSGLSLILKDNGPGFNFEEVKGQTSYGIRNIEARLSELALKYQYQSSVKNGTSLGIRLAKA